MIVFPTLLSFTMGSPRAGEAKVGEARRPSHCVEEVPAISEQLRMTNVSTLLLAFGQSRFFPEKLACRLCSVATDIVALGEVLGSCKASDHLDIRSEASLYGDVVVSRISVEDGAFLTGSVDIRRESALEASCR